MFLQTQQRNFGFRKTEEVPESLAAVADGLCPAQSVDLSAEDRLKLGWSQNQRCNLQLYVFTVLRKMYRCL